MKKLFGLFIVALLIAMSCRKEEAILSRGIQLKFSTDTVFLDTVFTTIGSSTYTLKVFNPEKEKVIIDNIRLGKAGSSFYRMNVNGTATQNINRVEILPEDSIYIFVEVTPNVGSSTELVYTDSIIFTNKGTVQHVNLVTLTRDAHFHYPDKFLILGNPPNTVVIPYSIINCNETWVNDKPHVIYGYAVVDSACTLTINPGAEVYFHDNSGLWVFDHASLRVNENSTPGNGDSVIFAGDRLEPAYEDIPGQWGGVLGGIFISGRSTNNVIRNAVIKNAVNALRIDSVDETQGPNLHISSSYVLNSSRTAIYGGYGNMTAENLVVANSGLFLFYALGGSYEFKHCTFANYWNQSTRSEAAVTLSNFFEFNDGSGVQRRLRSLNKAYFGNCIIHGNNRQELNIAEDLGIGFNYELNHALLKVDPDEEDRGYDISDINHFIQLVVNGDPVFLNTDNNNYDLDTTSQAIDQANLQDALDVDLDIKGRIRNGDIRPDLGAFEFQK